MRNLYTKTCVRLVLLSVMSLTGTELFAQGNKPASSVTVVNTPDVNVVNTPAVTVANTPAVTVANTPAVTVVNTPGVTVANTPNVVVTNADPIAVTLVGGANPNPGLPAFPLFAFKNAEGSSPVLFGPFAADKRIAVTSLTLDGGSATFGTQLWLYITNCDPSSPSVQQIVTALMVRNRAAGQGPQHMAFPTPMVLPASPVAAAWCLQASPVTADQILITAVGYAIQ